MIARLGMLLLAASLSLAAHANDTGFFVLGNFGQSKFDVDPKFDPGTNVDDTGNAFKLGGGYMFHRNVGVELGYADLGELTATDTGGARLRVTSGGPYLAVVGMLPLFDNRFALLGRLGAIYAETHAELQDGTDSSNQRVRNASLTFGLGAQYNVTQRLGVRIEFDHFSQLGDKSEDKLGFELDANVLSLGVVYRFY